MPTSVVPGLSASAVTSTLRGLPEADGYTIQVQPLDYVDRPFLSAWTDFETRSIHLLVPDPFVPFGEVIPYAARRRPGSDPEDFDFLWLSQGLTFTHPEQVVRFLYLHEWMHWFLKERLGKKSHAETACDRFALANFERLVVTEDDARSALKRSL